MTERECAGYLDRLDRREPGYAADPHPAGCPSCADQLRTAMRIDAALATPPAGDPPGPSFAQAIAMIASAERRSAPRESAGIRLLTSTPFVTTAALTAIAVSLRYGMPHVVDALRIQPIAIGDPAGAAGLVFGILGCIGVGALAGIRLVRKAL